MAEVDFIDAILYHDPRLAKEIFSVYSDISGKENYGSWLRNYVKPLAKAVKIKLVDLNSPVRPDDIKSITLTFKAPKMLAKKLDEIARQVRLTRSELIRLILYMFVLAWEGDNDAEMVHE